jgi:arginyl-tRNA--protein-N-Asp/Glu arginylyltransferase
MITGIIEPDSLSRAELDRYLELGWYRIGRTLITTDYLVSDGEVRSAVWTRVDLHRHRWKSSLRKRMARNARRFRVEVGEMCLDEAHERLYARYREMVGGDRAATLDDVLGGEEGRRLFETREIRIFHGDELAAFSWFDLGEVSVESLIGVYDPEHRRHGLGFYTMLLEIEHAAQIGMRYHYSGYVLSEPSSMDYKRQVGELQYLDPRTMRWIQEPPHAAQQSPAEILRRRLREAAGTLERSGASVVLALNAALMFPALRARVPACATDPLLLVCTSSEHPWGVQVTWDQKQGCYVLLGGRPLSVSLDDEEGHDSEWFHLFLIQERLGDHATADEVAFWARHHLASVGPESE